MAARDYLDLKDRAQNMALVEDDTLAGVFVNDVYTDLVVQGQLKCTSSVETLSSTQNVYNVVSDWGITDLGMIQYLVYKAVGMTQGYILDQTDLETVLQLNSTVPTGYVRKYAFQGLNSIYVWPYPQNNGDTITVYYAQTPTALTINTDLPVSVPTQWQHLISIGAAARLTDAVGEDVALATALQEKYETLYASFVKWVKGRQGRGTQIMGSGYSRTVGWPPHDRSAYYSPDVSNY